MNNLNANLVILKSFTYLPEALLAKAQLESCQAPVFIKDQYIVDVHAWCSQAVGGVKLLVLESDVELARNILNEFPETIDESNTDNDCCPKCESQDVIYDQEWGYKKRSWLTVISFLFLSLPWLFKSKYFKCQSCGYHWKI